MSKLTSNYYIRKTLSYKTKLFLGLMVRFPLKFLNSGEFMDRTSKSDNVHFWVIQLKKPSEQYAVATSHLICSEVVSRWYTKGLVFTIGSQCSPKVKRAKLTDKALLDGDTGVRLENGGKRGNVEVESET